MANIDHFISVSAGVDYNSEKLCYQKYQSYFRINQSVSIIISRIIFSHNNLINICKVDILQYDIS